jgi:hypothetical protein
MQGIPPSAALYLRLAFHTYSAAGAVPQLLPNAFVQARLPRRSRWLEGARAALTVPARMDVEAGPGAAEVSAAACCACAHMR